MFWLFSLWLHPDCTVQPDGFSVHHVVLNDVLDQVGVLIGVTQPRGVWDSLGQVHTNLFGKRGQQRSIVQSWGYCVHTDTLQKENI